MIPPTCVRDQEQVSFVTLTHRKGGGPVSGGTRTEAPVFDAGLESSLATFSDDTFTDCTCPFVGSYRFSQFFSQVCHVAVMGTCVSPGFSQMYTKKVRVWGTNSTRIGTLSLISSLNKEVFGRQCARPFCYSGESLRSSHCLPLFIQDKIAKFTKCWQVCDLVNSRESSGVGGLGIGKGGAAGACVFPRLGGQWR